jgi:hypothetical protein
VRVQKPLALGEALARVDVVPCVSRTSAPVTALALSVEHSICDGMSIASLCHDFLTQLAKFVASPLASLDAATSASAQHFGPALEAATKARGVLAPFVTMSRFMRLIRMPRGPFTMLPGANKELTPLQLARSSATVVLQADVSADATTRLLNLCRARNTTVNSALMACLSRAAAVIIASSSGPTETVDIGLGLVVNPRRVYTPPLPSSVLGFHVSGMLATYKEPLV